MDRMIYSNGERVHVGDLFVRRRDFGLVVNVKCMGGLLNDYYIATVFWGGDGKLRRWAGMERAVLIASLGGVQKVSETSRISEEENDG
jgi:hypothetical protein